MRGITIHQPFATAIALSDPRELGAVAKMVENRSWAPWPSIIGTHIAIHAGVRAFDPTDAIDVGRKLYGNDAPDPVWRRWIARLTADAGRILCVARVCGSTAGEIQLPSQRRWKIKGQIGWLLEDVRTLPRPLSQRGAQGLWVVPHDIELQIRAQLKLENPTQPELTR